IVEGARVVLPMPASGCRTYVAWSGAAEIPPGQVAGAGEQWTADPRLQPIRIATLPEHLRPNSLRARPLRVIEGPQWELLDSAQLLRTAFRTTPRMDRVGIRLDGPFLGVAPEIVSEPATFGSIQATSSGELVILGPDGPTIGGYPKVATVIDADLDRLGQLRPGDEVTFELVDMEQARELRIERCRRLHRLLEDRASFPSL
ncbi:MAG TPA: hypothetical protein VM328_02110, partial [Fimbriimonadaceae bacterium]|nr:hypothetical protein [Fimbriimonadaceae bacterium]